MNNNLKKILITGGAGFIGSHSVDLFLQSGYRVTVIDNLSSGKITNLDLFNSNLEFIPGDILDFPLLLTHVKRNDAVLHLASIPSVQASINDPVQSLKVNTQGFLHVLEAVRQAEKTLRLIYASSASVYGDTTNLPCDENQPHSKPLSPYALDKLNNENYAEMYAKLFSIQSLGLRYFNVYGKRQDPKSPYAGVIAKFAELYRKEEELIIFGDGKQSRDFISVNDVARANLLALQSDLTGALNIATGVPETLLNLIKYIEKTGNTPARINFMPAKSGDIKESYANIEQAKTKLNFSSKMSLEEGIALLLQ